MSKRNEQAYGCVVLEGNLEGSVTIMLKDGSGYVLMAKGTAVPSGSAGYAKSALFIKTDAGSGTKGLYENTGTTSSCSFNLIGEIASGDIADGAVTSSKITTAAVLASHISANQIVEAHISAGQVTASKIGAAAILTAHISNSQVTASKIGTAAVLTAHISDAQVTASKIGAAAVLNSHLTAAAVRAAHIALASFGVDIGAGSTVTSTVSAVFSGAQIMNILPSVIGVTEPARLATVDHTGSTITLTLNTAASSAVKYMVYYVTA